MASKKSRKASKAARPAKPAKRMGKSEMRRSKGGDGYFLNLPGVKLAAD